MLPEPHARGDVKRRIALFPLRASVLGVGVGRTGGKGRVSINAEGEPQKEHFRTRFSTGHPAICLLKTKETFPPNWG